jgi:hypothetical protein
MMRRTFRLVLAAALFILPLPLATGDASTGPSDTPLVAAIKFRIACDPASQTALRHAVLRSYSAAQAQAGKQIIGIAEPAPGCVMAYWRVAMDRAQSPPAAPNPAGLAAPMPAAPKATATSTGPAPASDRLATIFARCAGEHGGQQASAAPPATIGFSLAEFARNMTDSGLARLVRPEPGTPAAGR